MCSCRRMARTSRTSTTWTRAPALLPSAKAAASSMPRTRSRLNLFIPSSSPHPRGALDACREFRQGRLRFGRHILTQGLGIDHEQEQRRCRVVVEVDHPYPSPLARSLAPPAHLADTAGILDHVARVRVARDEIHKFVPLGIRPYVVSLPHELRRLDDGERDARHLCAIRQWRLLAMEKTPLASKLSLIAGLADSTRPRNGAERAPTRMRDRLAAPASRLRRQPLRSNAMWAKERNRNVRRPVERRIRQPPGRPRAGVRLF